MKKLYLLMLAILLLGCGTETSVVEEPEPVIEKSPPPVKEHKPSHHPLVADGTVKNGEVNVDPGLLNEVGFVFYFKQDFLSYSGAQLETDGEYLGSWNIVSASRNAVHIGRMADFGLLEYDTEYQLAIYARNFDCESVPIVIQFRTKPQRPVVGRPAPVIQERPPAVGLGERLRLDISLPAIVAGTVTDGDDNVDPEPLNENGIQFEFDENINRYKIDLRLREGASLGWLPRDLVRNDMGRRIQITPAEGVPLLEFDTTYEIDILVEDVGCLTVDFTIAFRTKPKP